VPLQLLDRNDTLPFLKVRSYVYVTDTNRGAVSIKSAVVASGQQVCFDLVPPQDSVEIIVDQNCSDTILSTFMAGKPSFWFESVYPNPTHNSVTVTVGTSHESVIIYFLYNILGEAVRQGSLSSNTVQIDLSDLPEGEYYLQLSDAYLKQSRKISVIH